MQAGFLPAGGELRDLRSGPQWGNPVTPTRASGRLTVPTSYTRLLGVPVPRKCAKDRWRWDRGFRTGPGERGESSHRRELNLLSTTHRRELPLAAGERKGKERRVDCACVYIYLCIYIYIPLRLIRDSEMQTSQILFFILTATLFGTDALKITKMTVPKFVKNGTVESVLLDCEYDYDSKKDDQLVVKWFHNDDTTAVYQWIAELNRVEISPKFNSRVDVDYELPTGNDFTRRRALNLLNPTTEMSGIYSCHVSSLGGQDSKIETMMVYAHPADVYLNYSVSNEMVRVMCIIEGVFPIPEVAMFQIGPGKLDPTPVDDTVLEHEVYEDAYNVIVSTNLTEEELQTDTLRYFGCIVAIPGTSYNETKKLPYIPTAKAEMVGGDPDYNDFGSKNTVSTFFVIVCVLFLTHIFSAC